MTVVAAQPESEPPSAPPPPQGSVPCPEASPETPAATAPEHPVSKEVAPEESPRTSAATTLSAIAVSITTSAALNPSTQFVEARPRGGAIQVHSGEEYPPPPPPRRRIPWLFLCVVVLPTLLATLYFGVIASDVFISESTFVVRSPQSQAPTGLTALLHTGSFSRSQDDTYTVHDYILSRDALGELSEKLQIKEAFSRPGIDFLSRFAAIDGDDSEEALHKFYKKKIGLSLDSSSSISQLQVRAFSAAEAMEINKALLDMGERLINQLNERARQDTVRFAQAQVEAAEIKAKDVEAALSKYRDLKKVFDPEKQSASQLLQINKLKEELFTIKTRLVNLLASSPSNPQIATYRRTIEALENEVKAETDKVLGGQDSLSGKAAEYERLVLDRGFAEKELTMALAARENARLEAQRKQLYLERIAQPHRPDRAVEPKRLRRVVETAVLGLISWGILTMVVAGIREHQD